MPQIKVRGVEIDTICKLSGPLINELAELTGSSQDDFTLELLNSAFIANGGVVPGYPFVEVAWFDRGQEAQDHAAKIITRLIHEAGYPSVDIMFTILDKSRYYENGEHY
ncbi:protein of unknown function (DUF1904) [Desulfosporosinus orientis DSM 765]|uniref:DUF1904 domain-containing protein n=1 Tax=Desulfosporosinus orientis (strain ATCC 19365 / DSM 765 / NCIMB 8382 / VKM B-1628 / Singapore I) TaxID=768706 RepID=G7WFW8_DESOD|nr:DUF1904 domain-containing protein [Desulfosporosinus orientis]AET69483.1 protein of unknown function (DUF1904) [Desulfosporosinus orientis DSM 765]